MKNTIGLLNTTIITAKGLFDCQSITVEEAKELAKTYPTESHVGHQATSDAMSTLLDIPVPMDRTPYLQNKVGQRAICLKVRGRIAEGKILTREELEAIGYDFFLLEKVAESKREFEETIGNLYGDCPKGMENCGL